MTLVPPDGPIPCDWAVVGSAPAGAECRDGRGFVGPSGDLMWPLMRRLALLNRGEVYVTNLKKTPFPDYEDPEEMDPAELQACRAELLAELARVRPRRILAVGALAARALLGDRYTTMEACNGIGFALDGGAVCVPTWHPAASLRPGGEDRLAYTGAAIAAFRHPKIHAAVTPPAPEPWTLLRTHIGETLGVDTEGTPSDPICATVATRAQRVYVPAASVPTFFKLLDPRTRLLFHNALWDWPVLAAMGVNDIHSRWAWADTMELAYLRQTEPRGLKDLAYRHLGLRMRSFEDVVAPHYNAMLVAVAEGIVASHSTHITLSPKGRVLKRPRVVVDEVAKPLKRALGNPKLLAERLPWMPPMSLRYVPEQERVEYATLDAWATVMLEEHLR